MPDLNLQTKLKKTMRTCSELGGLGKVMAKTVEANINNGLMVSLFSPDQVFLRFVTLGSVNERYLYLS
jgi:hypothetical protein